jgi:hypothetical protein
MRSILPVLLAPGLAAVAVLGMPSTAATASPAEPAIAAPPDVCVPTRIRCTTASPLANPPPYVSCAKDAEPSYGFTLDGNPQVTADFNIGCWSSATFSTTTSTIVGGYPYGVQVLPMGAGYAGGPPTDPAERQAIVDRLNQAAHDLCVSQGYYAGKLGDAGFGDASATIRCYIP